MVTELGGAQISSLLETLPGIAQVLRSPVADAFSALIRQAARHQDFQVESAEEVLRYSVRRNLMSQEESDRIMAELREGAQRKAERAADRAEARKPAATPVAKAIVKAVAKPVVKAVAKPVVKAVVKPVAKPKSQAKPVAKSKAKPAVKVAKKAKPAAKKKAPARKR